MTRAVLATLIALAVAALPARGDAWSDTGPSYWIEAQLRLISRDQPWPTVQARTLFHVSAAMHDAWAALEPDDVGVLADEACALIPEDDQQRERLQRIALGHAAIEVLKARYPRTNRDGLAVLKFEHALRDDGLLATLEGDDARAAELGQRIARRILADAMDDGSNEAAEYDDTTGYTPANAALDPDAEGTVLTDPDRWQPIIVEGRTQEWVTPHWGRVRPFAISKDDPSRPYLDPGPPPRLKLDDHAALSASLVELILLSSRLDGTDTAEAPEDADVGRVLAEYWEGGASTETPVGRWNLIAATALHHAEPSGDPGKDLRREIELFLALNASLHDAAIACWDIKRYYDSVRPISLIRHMGGLGQSSDPSMPGYHKLGLPLVPGLVELVTEVSSAPGERHAHLADRRGEVAVRSWRGNRGRDGHDASGVGWIPATAWLPYQDEDFVTPAFGGYVSGHSTSSAAGATVLEAFFGEVIPGGPVEVRADAGVFLEFEVGPFYDVVLSAERFDELVEQAGRSRLWGGIHPWFDDVRGREVGEQVAMIVLARLQPVSDDEAAGSE